MKVFQPIIVGNFLRSVHAEKNHYHITWHSTASIVKIYADGPDVLFFTEESDEAIPYRAARQADHAAAKRALYDLLLALSNKDEAEQ